VLATCFVSPLLSVVGAAVLIQLNTGYVAPPLPPPILSDATDIGVVDVLDCQAVQLLFLIGCSCPRSVRLSERRDSRCLSALLQDLLDLLSSFLCAKASLSFGHVSC